MDVTLECAGKRSTTRSVDISQGGILLERTGSIPSGEIIGLGFTLPGSSKSLKLLGKAIREERAKGVAVEFIDPDPADRDTLERYILASTKEK